jgi:hypothetical protein
MASGKAEILPDRRVRTPLDSRNARAARPKWLKMLAIPFAPIPSAL